MTLAGSFEQRIILSAGDLYVKAPGSIGEQPGKPWVKSSGRGGQTENTEVISTTRNLLRQLNAPTALAPLKSGHEIAKLESEPLNVPTTHYKIVVAPDKAREAVPDGHWKDCLNQHAQAGHGEITYHVWVDGRGLPRQWTSTIGRPAGNDKPSVKVKYSEWGEPVEITPPPPEKVAEFTDGWVESE